MAVSSTTSRPSSYVWTVAAIGDPWARTCTAPDHSAPGGWLLQFGRIAAHAAYRQRISRTDLMVLVVGAMASTKRGSPSGAGVPSRSPAAARS